MTTSEYMDKDRTRITNLKSTIDGLMNRNQALEMEISRLKAENTKANVTIVGLLHKNQEFETEISRLKNKAPVADFIEDMRARVAKMESRDAVPRLRVTK